MAKAYEEQNTPGTGVPAPYEKRTSDLPRAIERVSIREGYSLFKNPGEINIWYVEGMNVDGTPNDNRPNQFSDARIAIEYVSGQPVIRGIWDATTEPSRYWTEHPMNANGAARIKFGQQRAWVMGHYHGYEALIQSSPVTVYRDKNKTYKRTAGTEDTGMFGIFHHNGYDLPHDDLGRSSAGCLVGRTKYGHQQFIDLLKKDPRFQANNKFEFTATVIPFSTL